MATILIVDDCKANREVLLSLLAHDEHRLLQAADGAEALAIARAARPDLIIADILMPTMDGSELVRMLRADANLADIRVIYYTAHYHESEARRLAEVSGVAAVLRKPSAPAVIIHTVNTILGKAAAPAPPFVPDEFDREHLQLLTNKLLQQSHSLHKTNERLRQSELRLKEAQRLARLGHWWWEPHSGSVDWSDEIFRLFGLDPKTTQPGLAAFASALHPEDRYIAHQRVQAMMDGVDTFASDLRVVHPNGELVWLHSRAHVVRDPQGRVRYVEGTDQDITERKRAEAEVRQSGDLLRAVAEGTNEAVFVKDLDGKYLLFNEAAARFVGKPVAAVLGFDDTTLFEAAGVRQLMDSDRKIMLSGMVESVEETLTAAGVTRTYLSTKGPYRDVTGKVAGLVGISRDITDRKRLEQRLKTQHAVVTKLAESHDMREAAPHILRAIGEATGWDVGQLWMIDQYTGQHTQVLFCVDYWNADGADQKEFRALSQGLTLQRGVGLPGRVWAQREPVWIMDLGAQEWFLRSLAAARSGLRGGFAFPIRFGGQVLGVIEFFSRELRQPDEELLQMFDTLGSQIGQFVERVRVESGLRLFRALIEQATDGVMVIDPNTGHILDANERACMVRGYTREEFLQLRIADVDMLVTPHPWQKVVAQRRVEGAQIFEGVHRRKDGSTFPVEVNLTFIRLDREYMVAMVRDITERKTLEDQFRQAQKMEAVGLLAGGIAHDFNNLLTVINGYSQLLIEGAPPTDPNRELIQEVLNAGKRAADLTHQLLTFSRKAVIKPRTVDLKRLVADIERMLRRIVREDIEMEIIAPDTTAAVRVDPSQLEQVIVNLVVNACDAMPKGGKLIIALGNVELDDGYARAHPDAGVGPHVVLSCSDTGCGMDAATVVRIFEPFFSTKGEQGTGLGLATVHGIVKQAGGHVTVHSELGRGTTFKIYLPRVDAESPKIKPRTPLLRKSKGGETVLLVEDEAGVRTFIRRILQEHGYAVLEARDGAAAVQLADQYKGHIRLLITDVVMPHMGGPEVARKIALLHPQIKVLYLSGYTDAAFRHGIGEAEVAFLQKPFNLEALTTKVRDVLDGGEATYSRIV